ncbi:MULTISPECIES: aromatic ring-hydroxylating dioxygenase subunit alpha [Novosphingobium]|uniref:Phenylpropionate dioxygenase-like ring-hydroxylating dioxygenase large terminal subunit n=1 Tax=Novosphingobium taihuense TaxID=260085 RepID=A0A7W7AAX9_9SPHN|nr:MULTISPECIES: SRPBCC family protein [Novosphingobium]MBB4613034.1 phenylpropionate dioxygenase-like ring-hydroxylating dioxygenase large terminal subunit [Novosphingobium taihuense]TWH85178.1 Rieske-like 2Fe-2S protein [Novosphingobium taihuense]
MNAPAKTAEAAALPLVQTFDMLSTGQRAAMQRIARHDEAEVPQIDFQTPASMFTSAERFALEQQHLFRARAVPLAVSALIAENGTAMGHDALGIPLIISRDKQGQAHVFLNACQHKGAKLLETCEPMKAARMTCPYHAWTFGLDGKLLAVARPETFVGLDKSSRNLVELPSREHGGIIWVMLDRNAEPDFSPLVPELAEDLEALDLPRLHVYGRKRFEIAANWKLVLEPFLEGYHVQRLHAQTVGPMFADVPNVVDLLGPTIRQISGKANFTPDDLALPGENIHKTVTTVYNMFPNCVVITSPWYISVMLLHPRAADHTTVEYHMLTRSVPDNPKAEELYARSYEMVLNVFGNEDFRAAEISHAGLATGALDTCVYSGLEASIATYYGVLDGFMPG